MFNGVLQQDSQLLRVVVVVNEAVPPLGDEPGGAGVLRYDGRLAEDQTLGDKGGHGVIAGGAHHTGALIHQGLDLRAFQPLAVEHRLWVIPHQTVHGVVHPLVGGFAHKEEGGFFPHRRGQQPDGIAEDILKEFLLERGEDVQKIMMFDLTYEKQMENAKREWYNDGVEEGRAEGYSSGIAEGAVHHLVASVVKKVQKNKTLDQIADELEESVEDIQPIYDIVKKHAPEYDVDAITTEVLEARENEKV